MSDTIGFVCPHCLTASAQRYCARCHMPGLGTYNAATFSSMAPTNCLALGRCGISINLETGEVTIPESLSLTDASRAFWDAVQRITGQKVGFE